MEEGSDCMRAAGNETATSTPADIVFVIEEKPHPRFKREGNDLVYTATLKLSEALCGALVCLLLCLPSAGYSNHPAGRPWRLCQADLGICPHSIMSIKARETWSIVWHGPIVSKHLE